MEKLDRDMAKHRDSKTAFNVDKTLELNAEVAEVALDNLVEAKKEMDDSQ